MTGPLVPDTPEALYTSASPDLSRVAVFAAMDLNGFATLRKVQGVSSTRAAAVLVEIARVHLQQRPDEARDDDALLDLHQVLRDLSELLPSLARNVQESGR